MVVLVSSVDSRSFGALDCLPFVYLVVAFTALAREWLDLVRSSRGW